MFYMLVNQFESPLISDLLRVLVKHRIESREMQYRGGPEDRS